MWRYLETNLPCGTTKNRNYNSKSQCTERLTKAVQPLFIGIQEMRALQLKLWKRVFWTQSVDSSSVTLSLITEMNLQGILGVHACESALQFTWVMMVWYSGDNKQRGGSCSYEVSKHCYLSVWSFEPNLSVNLSVQSNCVSPAFRFLPDKHCYWLLRIFS